MDVCTFEDEDIISVDSIVPKEKIHLVSEELDRGAKLYEERNFMKRRKKNVLKPLYNKERKLNQAHLKIPIYKLYCYKPKLPESNDIDYPLCKHTGNIIIDRDILSQEEHVEFLAQPKLTTQPIPRKFKYRCYYVKKYLPNTTSHVERLSIPMKQKVMTTLKEFAQCLSSRHLDNLAKHIAEEGKDFEDVDKAIGLHREEKKKKLARKAYILRESAKIKKKIIKLRKVQVKEITYAIYEIMKPFLMQDHKVELNIAMTTLVEVLEWRIRNFTGILYSCDLVDKFLKNLATNLAIWLDRFITNFGLDSFTNLRAFHQGPVCPCEENELKCQLPIEDFIEVFEDTETEELEQEDYVEEFDMNEEGLTDIELGFHTIRSIEPRNETQTDANKVINYGENLDNASVEYE